MKLAILTAIVGSAAAFAPASTGKAATALRMSDQVVEEIAEEIAEETAEPSPLTPPALVINGWTSDAALPCYGLPGSIAPTGFFDPLGFTKDADLNTVKRYREAEIMHGRVAMMATLG